MGAPAQPAARDPVRGPYGDMTAVFVHGVPETGALWNGMRAHLEAETVALDLPGFGTPRPAGFGATKDEYVAWVADALRGFDGPVDVVGHDWGPGSCCGR